MIKNSLTAVHTSWIASPAAVKKLPIASHAPIAVSCMLSQTPLKNSTTASHTARIASIASPTVSCMLSQRSIQNCLNSSDLFQSTTNAATRPAIAPTINPIGLAAITAFSSACFAARTISAAVMPCNAVVTAVIIATAFHARKAVPIATIRASILGRLSTIHLIPSLILGRISLIKYPNALVIPVLTFSIILSRSGAYSLSIPLNAVATSTLRP